MDRRTQVVDAALIVLGRDGMRALTHRTVDREAGLAEGSASNIFRTRHALLDGVAERLEERDRLSWDVVARGRRIGSLDDFVEIAVAWIERAVDADRHCTSARFALFLVAQNQPRLRKSFDLARTRLETWGRETLRRDLGIDVDPDTVSVTFDQLDGLILHLLCFPKPGRLHRSRLREAVTRILDASLSG